VAAGEPQKSAAQTRFNSKAFPFPFPRGEGEENSSWAAVFSLPKEPEMLLRKEVTQASDVELLAVNSESAEPPRRFSRKPEVHSSPSSFAMPHEGGDMSCAQGSRGYAADPA